MASPPAALVVLAALAVPFAGRAPGSQATVAAQALAIVVHRSNPVDNLSFSDLRRIFMLDTQSWPHGRKITVVLREKGQVERSEAIRIICGLSERDYEKHILFRTFQGGINIGPRAIQSTSAMLRFVYNAPGAIGYVGVGEVDASVKLLRIDGMLPDDASYPVRRVRGPALRR
jgi:phosphate transport system substrate-binding protein